jgi:dynein heavy chain 2
VVDPDDLATRWLRKYASLGDAKLEIISNTDSNLWKIFELCVRLGKSLLIEDCMHVDPFLYPILRNEIIHEGSRKVVLLGNKKVDYNNDFRLIISSKRKFKGLKQSIHALMRHVRFAMSSSGMETVLASVLVHQGNPDLERSLKETKEQEEIHNEKIELLENKLLEVLGSTNGDIIEDDILVQSLIDTVESAKAISELITRNNVMREKLEETKATYSEASSFGSKLYSLLMQLKKVGNTETCDSK